MQIFRCATCDQAIYFENFLCVRCGRKLAYVPALATMAALEPAEGDLWLVAGSRTKVGPYRLCRNYSAENVCNWVVAPDDENELCVSCRLTRKIPDLSRPGNREAWFALEGAKRRLLYALLALRLPLEFPPAPGATPRREAGPASMLESVAPLTFEFLGNIDDPQAAPVITGHAEGVITVNVAEANDAEREKRRLALHEPYRTLLGHLRHESGHFYWDRLIQGSPLIDRYRELFGDERRDYAASLKQHYENGPPGHWQSSFVSAYASVHPWEDWAETWAHYLHLTDTLDTASACGLAVRPRRRGIPGTRAHFCLSHADRLSFDRIMNEWMGVAFLLNNLSRGLGQNDPYPFVLSLPAIEKLRFVHEVVIATQKARRRRRVAASA